MKKRLSIICAGALMSAFCVGLAACHEPGRQDEDGTVIEIQPVSVSNEIANSVDMERLAGIACRELKAGDVCVMINSMEELPKVDYNGNTVARPNIDFNAYTLILGRFHKGGGGYVLSGQWVVVGSKEISLNLRAEQPYGYGGTTSPSVYPFWGLYPKLPNLAINVVCK